MDYQIKPVNFPPSPTDSTVWEKVVGKNNTIWYIPQIKNVGSWIHASDNDKSGYGGSKKKFLLQDGSIDEVIGPWHSNPDALFRSTGKDLRDQVYTFVVIGTGRDHNKILNVIYEDPSPQVGVFNRGEQLANNYANDLGKTVILYSKSETGSSTGPVEPINKKINSEKIIFDILKQS